jgi:hypothetical protein
MSKANIDGLVDVVMKELMDFRKITEEEFEEIAKEVAKEGAKKLKETSPRGRGSRKGHYADGWGVTYQRKGNGKFEFVVHNKKKPGLTHLLENGHQSDRGGRVEGIVHIKPVEEWCNEEFEKRTEERLGR